MRGCVLLAILAGVLAISSQADAFEIQGRVVDYVTQAGVDGVVVSFLTLDGKAIEQVKTDRDGKFLTKVPEVVKQFRIAYAKADGGTDGLGYEGYGRTFPVDNNARLKDVDTVALRPRRKEAGDTAYSEKIAIVKDWLSHYLVTKEREGVGKAIKFYAIDEASFKQSVRQLETQTGPAHLRWETFVQGS